MLNFHAAKGTVNARASRRRGTNLSRVWTNPLALRKEVRRIVA